MILPHYQDIKDDILDGKRLFEDITYPDSYDKEFYALTDGSNLKYTQYISEMVLAQSFINFNLSFSLFLNVK